MEACVRGFSYMPDAKVEVIDLQYIEGGELERTWKASRRQRLKEQEQKIWDEFVKEQDIVKAACTEDPYQFLHQLPENCLKELMEAELQKMKEETQEEKNSELPSQGEGDQGSTTEKQVLHTVTFADDEKDDCMFHIFDDEHDVNEEMSGPEEEAASESPDSAPGTVRERRDASPTTNDVGSSKSSENVTSLIESSINCARVKDLRTKINEEMLAIISSLERGGACPEEGGAVWKLCRRAAQFCGRFNRIYVYQLQRQMHDIKRAVSASVPFALHTHFQSQMVRIVSLHNSLLQALQIYHKSLEQTCCLRESAAMLRTLVRLARDASLLCGSVPTPNDFRAAHDLYSDEVAGTCDKVEAAVEAHGERFAHLLDEADVAPDDNTSTQTSRKSKTQNKPGRTGRPTQTFKTTKPWSNLGVTIVPGRHREPQHATGVETVTLHQSIGKDSDARLSMYSLDTLRINLTAKPTTSRDNHSRVQKSKTRVPESAAGNKASQDKTPKSRKTSPRSRRPLMRAGAGGPPRPAHPPDGDVTTMVQAVGTCTSSHASREVSPRGPRTPRLAKLDAAARKSQNTTPRPNSRRNYSSPKPKTLPNSPKVTQNKNILNSNRSDSQNAPLNKTPYNVLHVTNIHCATNEYDNSRRDENNIKKCNDRKGNLCSPKESHFTKDVNVTAEACDVETSTYQHSHIDKLTGNSQEIGRNDSRGKFGNTDNSGKDHNAIVDCFKDTIEDGAGANLKSPKKTNDRHGERSNRERDRVPNMAADRCEVSTLLRQLCSGDGSGSRHEKVSGAKNAQLFCMSGSPSRQPSTPQLLRILEETIQKKAPKAMFHKGAKNPERYRLSFSLPEPTSARLFQYRSRFVQHMLASSMYANSALGKPWEMIASVSEKIIEELLLNCAEEMEIKHILQELYNCETN